MNNSGIWTSGHGEFWLHISFAIWFLRVLWQPMLPNVSLYLIYFFTVMVPCINMGASHWWGNFQILALSWFLILWHFIDNRRSMKSFSVSYWWMMNLESEWSYVDDGCFSFIFLCWSKHPECRWLFTLTVKLAYILT